MIYEWTPTALIVYVGNHAKAIREVRLKLKVKVILSKKYGNFEQAAHSLKAYWDDADETVLCVLFSSEDDASFVKERW